MCIMCFFCINGSTQESSRKNPVQEKLSLQDFTEVREYKVVNGVREVVFRSRDAPTTVSA